MRVQSWTLLALAIIAPAVLSADVVVDSFNTTQPLATNTIWSPITDIGWYYTPSTSYTLDQLETTFDGAGTDRIITVGIYTDRPANGGTLLGSAAFDTSEAEGAFAGPTFSSGIPLTGGTPYFVALENIEGLGVNEVSFSTANGNSGPTGSVALGTTWQDSDSLAQFGTEGCSDLTNWFCKPEMEFLEANPTSPVPEPNLSVLLFGASAALVLVLRRKRAR